MVNVEIIACTVPNSKRCKIYLPKIKTNFSQEELWNELFNVFSQFGLIYKVFISPSKFHESNIFYGFICYYSCNAAKAALLRSGKIIINGQKIKIMKPNREYCHSNCKLTVQQAEELISYYFGFNAWTSEILYLEKDESENPERNPEVKYSCLIKITTKNGLTSEGVGTGEAVTNSANASSRGTSYMLARKFAVHRAMADAFSKILIILLPNGKRMIEVDTTKPDELYLDPSLDCPQIETIEELLEEPIEEDESNEWVENLSDSVLEKLLASNPNDH